MLTTIYMAAIALAFLVLCFYCYTAWTDTRMDKTENKTA